jgi:hypothetical protein
MQLKRIPASVSVTIPEEMATALAYWSRDALFSLGGRVLLPSEPALQKRRSGRYRAPATKSG